MYIYIYRERETFPKHPVGDHALGEGWTCSCFSLLRSVFIISNRKISNRASQILKTYMLLICPYCLEFQIARV